MERRNREHDPPVHHASLLKASNSVGKRREAAHGPVIKGVLAQPDVGFIQDATPQLHPASHESAEALAIL